MKLNLGKSQIFQAQVQYLGHCVSSQGIHMLPSHIKKILDWKLPSNGKDLQSFLGFVEYQRRSRLDTAMICSFEDFKVVLSKSPTRAYPDYSADDCPFILDTDFSAKCCGAVLSARWSGTIHCLCRQQKQSRPSQLPFLQRGAVGCCYSIEEV